jgi:hypothetical protein
MTANPISSCRGALLVLIATLLVASAASAQYVTFPRLGLSGAPDRYEPWVQVHGDETFEVYVIVLPAEGNTVLEHEYATFNWAVLEACCGGAAEIVSEDYNPACVHEGSAYGGVITTLDDCTGGEVIHLSTLTLQMAEDVPAGSYYVVGGPLGLAYDCAGESVLMTDMTVNVEYTSDITPVQGSSWSGVKDLFR